MRGEGSENVCFYPAQVIKLSKQRGGGKKWQNSVHVVVESPLTINTDLISIDNIQYSRPFQNDLGSEIPPSMQNKVKQIEF